MRIVPILLLVFLGFTACNSNKTNIKTVDSVKETNSKKSNNELDWEEPEMLLGDFELEALKEAPYNEWYDPIYEESIIEEEHMDQLESLLTDDIKIIAYIGSWCPDTQFELPNLIKTLDRINFNYSNLELIGVDEEYQAPDGSNKDWNITNVPTFILLQNDKELGRFVEFPDKSLAEDFIKILEKKD